jgi:hypothetical protein
MRIAATESGSMTVIEIRPYGNGWKCFEALGVEHVFKMSKFAQK